jgi:hypothetical protein
VSILKSRAEMDASHRLAYDLGFATAKDELARQLEQVKGERDGAEQTLTDVLAWDDGDGHPHPPSMFRLAKRHIRERHRTLNGQPTSIHDRLAPSTTETEQEEPHG